MTAPELPWIDCCSNDAGNDGERIGSFRPRELGGGTDRLRLFRLLLRTTLPTVEAVQPPL